MLKERIKKIRKKLNLTQQNFADKIGVKRNTVAMYEMGKTTPSDQAIRSISREFNINEDWLRNGTGDMLLPISRRKEIEKLTNQLLAEEEDSFKNRFIAMLKNGNS